MVETTTVIVRGTRVTAHDLSRRLRLGAVSARGVSHASVAQAILERQGRVTLASFKTAVGKSAAQARRILAQLVETKVLVAVGNKPWRHYFAPEHQAPSAVKSS